MPRTTRGGVEHTDDAKQNETSSSSPTSSADGTSAPRRRAVRRRVVRGAGAAGVTVALKVEEQETAKASANGEKPIGVQPEDAPKARKTSRSRETASETADASKKSTAKTTRRTRTRSRVQENEDASEEPATRKRSSKRRTADEAEEQPIASGRTRRSGGRARSRSKSSEVDFAVEVREQSASETVKDHDGYAQTHESHESSNHDAQHSSRPMTSLLFREPVLPGEGDDYEPATSRKTKDEDEDEDGGRKMTRRSSRASQSRRVADDAPEQNEERESRAGRSSSKRRTSNDRDYRNEGENISRVVDRLPRVDDDDDIDDIYDEEAVTRSERRTRRRRRLNAEERHAADEIELIEEDLEDDDIIYRPIDDVEAEQSGSRTRRSRGSERSGRGNRGNSRSGRAAFDADEQDDDDDRRSRTRRRRESEEDSEDQPLTRRRRRRRGSKGEESESDNLRVSSSRRSRKQQYIDEITDIEGSTRLEAKKQRRRDNRRERSRQNQLIEQDFLARRENVDRLMVVRERGPHTQISVIEDNVLVEHYVSDIQEVATVGNIYIGRVQNVLPSMEAAFVDIGQPRNGVLYAGEVNWDTTRLEGQPRRMEHAFKAGDPVLVQVTKDPIGHKGARLTSQITLAGRFLVLVPSGGMTGVSRKLPEHERGRLKSIISRIAPKGMGVIIRTAAEGASEEALEKDLENLKRQWDKIEEKLNLYRNGKRAKLLQGEPDVAIRVVRDIFNDDFSKLIVEGNKVYDRIEEYLDTMAPDLKDRLERWDPEEHEGKDVFDRWQIDSQLRKGMERQVYLPSGGSIVIDRTEAMTTIDVNTGRFIGKGKSLEETVTRCNLEASEEIARQLRLRDIGGMIMIDYVDMVMPANRDLVLRRLVECLARDRTKHQVAEVTSLGLVQMTRKRIGQGLVEAFSEECPTCKGRGFILHNEPTISVDTADPYAMKGGDPFVQTNKHGRGSASEVQAPKGSSPAVKAKLAQIAAAAAAATDESDADSDVESDTASHLNSSDRDTSAPDKD
ncbi:ribonuclease E [Bifidobacterium commune]|uniref:Ribonuclease E n=1 Tax=Bifidobacterium commune TaxID=1505727 RepID=A0A1C4H5V6_9BIFI|nr:ribonuclease E [Bifidobacterium commune]SCC80030.1 ribonuclease E [Bifidobacterium commune]